MSRDEEEMVQELLLIGMALADPRIVSRAGVVPPEGINDRTARKLLTALRGREKGQRPDESKSVAAVLLSIGVNCNGRSIADALIEACRSRAVRRHHVKLAAKLMAAARLANGDSYADIARSIINESTDERWQAAALAGVGLAVGGDSQGAAWSAGGSA